MNKVTRDIHDYINSKYGLCDISVAVLLQSKMEESGINFSECTQKEFKTAIHKAWEETA